MAEIIIATDLITSENSTYNLAVDELFRIEIDRSRCATSPVLGAAVFILIEKSDVLRPTNIMPALIHELEDRFDTRLFLPNLTERSKTASVTRQMNEFRRKNRLSLKDNLLMITKEGQNHWLLRRDATTILAEQTPTESITPQPESHKIVQKKPAEIHIPFSVQRTRDATVYDKRAFIDFLAQSDVDMSIADLERWCREKNISKSSLAIEILVEVAVRAGYITRNIDRAENGSQKVVYRRVQQ